jgi:hypothetical protein
MVELLVQYGADIHRRRADGRTAHTLAELHGIARSRSGCWRTGRKTSGPRWSGLFRRVRVAIVSARRRCCARGRS